MQISCSAVLKRFTGCLVLIALGACSTARDPVGQSMAPPPVEVVTVVTDTPPVVPVEPARLDEPPAGAVAIDPVRPDVPLQLDDSTVQDSARKDLWQRVRSGFAMPDLDTGLVRNQEQWYASRPEYVDRMTSRGGRYLFHIVEEVEKRAMPSELALLPFIESAFNPQALSSAKASGIWQFMPSTGKYFDLKQNVFRDDRRDVLASTRAALDYLQKLYQMFDDWHLALAAYNWGEGNVQRAIARNKRAGLPTDYLSLRMPLETQNYVPKLQAVKNIVSDPERFSLSLPPLENHPYFLAIPIERDIDVELAVSLSGLSEKDFRSLNPQINKPVILAAGTPQLLLPYNNADQFVRALKSHVGPLATWTAWTAPKTMRTSEAAQRVGMSEALLREVNRIPPRMLIKAGSTLLVTRGAHKTEDVSERVADNASMMLAAEESSRKRRVVVKVARKDTLTGLAKRYKVSVAQLRKWNRLGGKAVLRPGQRLVVFLPERERRGAAASKSVRGRVATVSAN